MFLDIKLNDKEPIYLQIYDGIKNAVESGMLPPQSKLPSTRELSNLLGVSRSTVINAYELLEENDIVITSGGKGTFVCLNKSSYNNQWSIDWESKKNNYALNCERFDIMKHELHYKKGMISFKSIAPDESLFDLDEVKRSFFDVLSKDGQKILNYGYAVGYKPLIEYLMEYMAKKGVDTDGKSIIITNGFTEGFDIVLSTILEKNDTILCENPTHNTAIKQMKLHELNIIGINNDEKGLDFESLIDVLRKQKIKAAYLIPSYHNPTGTVMSFEKRKKAYELLRAYNVPIIEDGFNEELMHLGSHIAPIAAISGKENSVIYIGSLSKVLFPGIRIGWILADKNLVGIIESVKRSRNIHTSFLDQGIFYNYMKNGAFEKYIKRAKIVYKEKYELALVSAKKYIPNEYILGDGGLYIFIKLKQINSRELLLNCYRRGVIFTPGDIFYTGDIQSDTLRIGFSRLSLEDIEKGIRIIGEEAQSLMRKFL